MKKFDNKLKGNHHGKFIADEIEKIDYSQNQFAISLDIDRQTLNAIINDKRKMSIKVALKIEKKLMLEEGFLLVLQTFYNIEQFKKK